MMGSTYSPAQKEASKRYQAKLKSLSLRLKPEEYDKFSQAAAKCSVSLRSFVLTAINEKISRDKLDLSDDGE